MRGTPVGKQSASGSSAAMRDFMSVSAAGSSTSSSPGVRPVLISPIGPFPTQTPEKSGVPSGKRGGGPSGTAPISAGLFAPPLPAGEVPGACWANATLRECERGEALAATLRCARMS